MMGNPPLNGLKVEAYYPNHQISRFYGKRFDFPMLACYYRFIIPVSLQLALLHFLFVRAWFLDPLFISRGTDAF
jgi:hypothetical protein